MCRSQKRKIARFGARINLRSMMMIGKEELPTENKNTDKIKECLEQEVFPECRHVASKSIIFVLSSSEPLLNPSKSGLFSASLQERRKQGRYLSRHATLLLHTRPAAYLVGDSAPLHGRCSPSASENGDKSKKKIVHTQPRVLSRWNQWIRSAPFPS